MSRKIWQCSVCKTRSTWGTEWTWYGNYSGRRGTSNEAEEIVLAVTCSKACREQHAESLVVSARVIA